MKNENKCFFSISLENGITITGDNPDEVLDFLYDAHSAFFSYFEYLSEKRLQRTANYAVMTMKQIGNAIDTIKQHDNTKK